MPVITTDGLDNSYSLGQTGFVVQLSDPAFGTITPGSYADTALGLAFDHVSSLGIPATIVLGAGTWKFVSPWPDFPSVDGLTITGAGPATVVQFDTPSDDTGQPFIKMAPSTGGLTDCVLRNMRLQTLGGIGPAISAPNFSGCTIADIFFGASDSTKRFYSGIRLGAGNSFFLRNLKGVFGQVFDAETGEAGVGTGLEIDGASSQIYCDQVEFINFVKSATGTVTLGGALTPTTTFSITVGGNTQSVTVPASPTWDGVAALAVTLLNSNPAIGPLATASYMVNSMDTGATITISAPGSAGNLISLAATSGAVTATASGATLGAGMDPGVQMGVGTATTGTGLNFLLSAGNLDTFQATNCTFSSWYNGILCQITETASTISNVWFTNCIFDGLYNIGLVLQNTFAGSNIWRFYFVNTWFQTQGANNVYLAGLSASSFGDITFIGCPILACAQDSVVFQSYTSDVLFLGCTIAGGGNSAYLSPYSYSGILMTGLANNIRVIGCRIGAAGNQPATFAYAINIGTYIQNVAIFDNNLLGNHTASLYVAPGPSSPPVTPTSTGRIRNNLLMPTTISDYAGIRVPTPTGSPYVFNYAGPFDIELYISGGVVTQILKNGVTLGLTSGTVALVGGDIFYMTYSSAPTLIAVATN